ncbi:MBL fold metallo-hydrolase [Ferrimonas balearica]|uniref:MBL fold metallo-hydrolase n=1 Tax=Ferrimonas balearica TaxID=44012 RepID=UPI001C99F8C8|nr:MBL fold metallo-hydrolase [Ferrimonas balearica]MBY5992940.1 MBL fold metallo-hydrolase [Ferrimonas balearica]
MKLHHLRSATFIIESGPHRILVDPMLGEAGSIPPFAVARFKARRNPTVGLPDGAQAQLDAVTHCLLTHSQTFGLKVLQHQDHLDAEGERFLRQRHTPVVTGAPDQAYLKRLGLNVSQALTPWQPQPFLGGTITAVPAQHGHGWIHRVMANGIGFYLELPGEPSLYISGDTVLTDDVRRALIELKPDIAILAAGQAQMDVGQPLLMAGQELVEFVRLAPGSVVANHMEALNHCPVDRPTLAKMMSEAGLASRVRIPADGQTLAF